MDTATSAIRAVEFTPSRDGDSTVLPELLNQIPEDEAACVTLAVVPSGAGKKPVAGSAILQVICSAWATAVSNAGG